MKSLASLLVLPCLAGVLIVPAARANTINGVAYCNISDADAGNTPAPGATSSGTLCATFTASSINFYSSGGSNVNNIGSFLNWNNALTSVTYANGFSASSNLDNSFFRFTGTAYFVNGQTYSATHDDGTVMSVNGTTVINSPNPTSAITTSFVFNGVTGNYNFVYDYTEKGGVSEYNSNATVDPVPEPGSILLFATGAAGLMFVVHRRRSLLSSF